MSGATPPEQARKLQGLLGSLVNTVIGGDSTESTTPTPTTTTPAPTTRTPAPTTRTPAPATRTPTPTTKAPVTKTPQPTTASPTPTPSLTPEPTPSSTPEPTPEPSSSSSESLTEAPETAIPTTERNATPADSFSASSDADITLESSSSSLHGSVEHWNTEASRLGDGSGSSVAVEIIADSPAVNTWMVIAITLGAVAVVLFCVGFVAWRVRRRKREGGDTLSPSFQRHLMISEAEKASDDTVNTRLDTSSTGPYTGGPRQGGGGYSASFLTAAQGSMWEDDTITAMRIPLEKLTKGKLLNKGGYGLVYRGSYRGEPVAIKTLLPESRKTLRHINAFLSEIKMMAALEHPRIVRLVGVAWDSLMDLCCVSEYMEGGDLRSLLNYVEYQECRPHGFDLEKARIALHVAHALTYLHSLDPLVLHRDLKSKNILLTENREAKVTDFGVSRESSDRTMTAGVGTSLWMAPEVMMGERYGSSADIFSFGVVLSELDSHVLPYAAAKETDSGRVIPDTALLQLVSLGLLRVEFSPHAPQALVDLAHACVNIDPEARPHAGEVLYRLQLIMNMLIGFFRLINNDFKPEWIKFLSLFTRSNYSFSSDKNRHSGLGFLCNYSFTSAKNCRPSLEFLCTDASSAVESMSRVNDQSDWSSGSGSSNSAASSESSDRSGNEGQGLNSGAIVAITLSCVVLLLGLLCLWFGRHKRWFRKSMSSTPLSAYMTAGNLPSGAQTPVIGLLSPFHTNNLESSASSSCSSMPIAMWEDEAITTMRIPFEKLTTTKLISYGGHGQVYLGTYRGEHVAIKRLLPEKRKKLHEVNDFLAEIKMMAKVDHPRIVRFIGVAWDSLTDLCAVSEFMDGGDLHSVLKHFEDVKRPHGFDFDKARIALQVAHALSYLHSLDPIVLHRDLKSMNILLTSELEAKITDFGVSRQWSVDTMTAGVGTALWMAPEVMMGEHYDASADIFSLGIVLSELDSHLPPYRETWSLNGQKISDTAILDMVASGQLRVEFSANAPRELVELGHACVDLDPTARPSASEVLYRLQVILRMYEAYTI
uniref:Protein kinase domain-containing protein n=1 Tax=Phytophthora ramorum TaxID=164328 RepID=H3H2F1_PHYRM